MGELLLIPNTLPNIKENCNMKKILLITFLLLQFSLYSQNTSQWNIGIEYSTDNISFSDDVDGIDYILTEGVNGYEDIKYNQNNYTLGLTTNYFFGEKWGISSGLLYSNKDFKGDFRCIYCNIYSAPNPEIIEQRFLVIPISINYSLLTGRLKPILEGGIKNNFEIQNKAKGKSKGYFLEAFIGASINYGFTENLTAGIGYNYQTAISDLYKSDEYNLRTSSFLLKINYELK